MGFNSLIRKTDAIFTKFNGEIIEKEDYFIFKTPNNPHYHWGNYLLFKKAPIKGEKEKWEELFQNELPYLSASDHRLFSWEEETPGELEEFLSDGYEKSNGVALATESVNSPKRLNNAVEFKVIKGAMWDDVLKNQILCSAEHFEDSKGYEDFKKNQFKNYQAMSEVGLGNWFGAYINGELVGDLGIYFEDDIARFQNIGTHPDHRRKGICQTLVFLSSLYAFENFKVKKLFMEADDDYFAAQIYQSVGFKPFSKNFAVSKHYS